ncbi:hypothetical protein LPJ78_002315 [Coemansia sp. RSA 989]|nr:hypothetical protein BX667DRAFT_472264 [Coemansia mojavensis]KAJ1740873.1 hypothetical protein LPJ68_003371 [Coemansia sp. RSA 1086]KAJ1749195.1 hypothetical protein LPJ79_003906 [Coemansia sp. RSA 1821]KAJ1865915.1 hypothetical protein LPJ78_002315 [Coemansia sp. RSA 989]KAJ1873059.1 hypothetical protein LPJ55_002621 [Coemansia sp. RSA 990]KAJ2628815.1 hypothetical protein H4R22_003674 [Coemansia sp. RSA 1290]KAJ2647859.1 hypothetical protein IWW40_004384 [Coemansia sp. RSA 1250]KAJ26733
MDASEIELYKQKLSEVELALSADPQNTELQQLKEEIKSLLSLSTQASTSKEHTWRIGDLCEARFSDGKYYPARVTGLKEGLFQVTFVGYGDVQEKRANEMRAPREPKKKTKRKRPDEVATGQQAWLRFTKGRKLKAKPINQKSIFKSPETVTGKVGVANSGRGMTRNPRPANPASLKKS